MEVDTGGGAPAVASASLSDLLSDLASHHERLEQVNRDLSEALAAAQASAGQVRYLLQETAGSPLPVSNAEEHEENEETEESEDNPCKEGAADTGCESHEFAVPSEWHSQVVQAQRCGNAVKGLHTVEIAKMLVAPAVDMIYNSEDQPQGSFTGSDTQTDHQDLPVLRFSNLTSQSEKETWDPIMNIVFQPAVERVQERLGKSGNCNSCCVTALEVHSAMINMGVALYHIDDIERWLSEVNRVSVESRRLRSSRGCAFFRLFSVPSLGSLTSSLGDVDLDGPRISCTGIPFKVFVEALLDDTVLRGLGSDLKRMSAMIREILFSGFSNRIVAEITRMGIEEVAGPMEAPDFLTRMEPLTAFVIVLNGIYIGLLTSASERSLGDAWFWGNVAFNLFMTLEVLMKLAGAGWKRFVSSSDRWWNLFDSMMVLLAVVDIAMEALWKGGDIVPISVMRIIRLTRLTKLIRLFRLRFMKELNLMVRGLIGGLQTLFWAITLLFFTLYVIGIMVTTMYGGDIDLAPEIAADELFSSVPRSIFTSFRCFMGDCATSNGRPIIKLAADAYGAPFVLGYIASMVFVIFGLFNLIVAVYVENTMHAARTDGKKDPDEAHRDAVRVAKQTRSLLKKFCAADRVWSAKGGRAQRGVTLRAMRISRIDDVAEISMQVSKELYLCVIQDPSVQKLMDDIDIPPERDHLFDVLDADCSGGLEIGELITGLLRVRGESRKSDAVGTLLAVRAVQDLIREQDSRLGAVEEFVQGTRPGAALSSVVEPPSPLSTVMRRNPSKEKAADRFLAALSSNKGARSSSSSILLSA